MRGMFLNIPNIDAFISKRTAKYAGKVVRLNDSALPKKFLAAWINKPMKEGAPQLTCNNNFVKAINSILPCDRTLSNNSALLKEWMPIAKDKKNWQQYIDDYFDSCRCVDVDDDDEEDPSGDDDRTSSESELSREFLKIKLAVVLSFSPLSFSLFFLSPTNKLKTQNLRYSKQ